MALFAYLDDVSADATPSTSKFDEHAIQSCTEHAGRQGHHDALPMQNP